jgi:Dna[CI] antecedent, DciA
MRGGNPRSIGELLRSGDISRLRAEALERRELAARVRAELGEAEAGHVVGAHVDDQGRLVIGMDSAAWAAKLRYSLSELCGRRIKVVVAVPGGNRP